MSPKEIASHYFSSFCNYVNTTEYTQEELKIYFINSINQLYIDPKCEDKIQIELWLKIKKEIENL